MKICLAFFAGIFLAGICDVSPAYAGDAGYNTKCGGSAGEYMSNAKGWKWWVTPFETVAKATINVGESTFARVAPSTPMFIFVGWLLWLVTFMMTQLGSLKEVDPMEMLTKVGGMMFKGMFAYALLTNQSFFFGYFVSPIIATGAGFVGIDAGAGGGMQSVVSPLRALMESMHKDVAQGIGIGEYAMCLSMHEDWPVIGGLFENDSWDGAPEFEVLASGCIMYIGSWILMLAFPFLIFDAMIRLGVTAALCPLFIAAWVFPITAEFTKKGLGSFLNVAFMFVCLKIILQLDVQMLMGASGMSTAEGLSQRAFMDHIIEGNNLIIAIVCVFYAIMFLLQATSLSNYFATTDFKNDTAWQAAQYAGGMAKNAAGEAMGAASGLAGYAAHKYSQGKDRSAARTLENYNRRKDAAAANGQPVPQMTSSERKAQKRLFKRGHVDGQGKYNDSMKDLLDNGKRRELSRLTSKGFNKTSSWIRGSFLKSEADIDKQSAALEKKITEKEKENPNYDQTKEGKKDYEKLMRYDRQKTELQNSGKQYVARNWLGRTWLGKGAGNVAGKAEQFWEGRADKKANMLDSTDTSRFNNQANPKR